MEITVDLDDQVMAELEQEAARQGRSTSEIVEGALRVFLAEQEKLNRRSSS